MYAFHYLFFFILCLDQLFRKEILSGEHKNYCFQNQTIPKKSDEKKVLRKLCLHNVSNFWNRFFTAILSQTTTTCWFHEVKGSERNRKFNKEYNKNNVINTFEGKQSRILHYLVCHNDKNTLCLKFSQILQK